MRIAFPRTFLKIMRIGVLDTDRVRADRIAASLGSVGHSCQSLGGKSAPARPEGTDLDLAILAAQDHDSQIAATIRAVRTWLPEPAPILLLANRTDEDGILAALAAGATDYLVEPLRLGELVTRVQVLLKRAYPDVAASLLAHFGQYAFDTASGLLTMAGKPVTVTRKEFELALLFFRHLGRPLSRAYIREAIWLHEPDFASRTLDTHVSRIRTKLGLRPENGFRLVPVYSYGYQLEQTSK